MNAQKRIDAENFDKKYLSSLFLKKLNDYRTEKGSRALLHDDLLEQTAMDQANYNAHLLEAQSARSKAKLATPELRARQEGGLYSEIEEVNLVIQTGVKLRLKGHKKKEQLNTYEEVANALFEQWTYSRHDKKLLLDETFYHVGIGTAMHPVEKLVFITIDMGVSPYIKIENLKYHKKAHRLNAYDMAYCRDLERKFEFLPQLMSDALFYKDGGIWFYFHNLNLVQGFLTSNKDGLAVEIIERSQFSCEEGNQLHPSGIHNGYLLKPVYKGKIFRKNPYKEQGEILVYLGAIPQGIDTNDIETNLLVMKSKCVCENIKRNNLDGENLRILDMDFAVDTVSVSAKIDSLHKHLNFVVPFEKNKYDYNVEDMKPFLDSIQLNRFDIKNIHIKAYSSIEGNAASNLKLQEKRAKSILLAIQEYQLQKVQTKIETFENWDGFRSAIADSPFAAEFKGLNNEQLRNLVNSDSLGYDLEPYLADQRKAEITIDVESIFVDSLKNDKLAGLFKKAIENKENVRALGIQTKMFREVEKGNLSSDVLFDNHIPHFPENIPMASNKVAFTMRYYSGHNLDSILEKLNMNIQALLGVTPKNAHLNYNKQLIKLYYWSLDNYYLQIDEEAKINEPKDLLKDIKRLYNTKIDNWKVNRLLLNYHLIAADFYYEREDVRMREKSLKEVKKFVFRTRLNQDESYRMALYFMFQMRLDWAIKLMLPYVRSGEASEEFLFSFLKIAIYDKKQVKDKQLQQFLLQAHDKNPVEYCELFGKPNMSFQLLINQDIKEDYCNNCYQP